MKKNSKKTTEEMINNLQNLKGKTKIKFNGTVSKRYHEMKHLRKLQKNHFEEDPSSRNAESVPLTMH